MGNLKNDFDSSSNTQTQTSFESKQNIIENIQSPENSDSFPVNSRSPDHKTFRRKTTFVSITLIIIICLCAFYFFIKYKDKPDLSPTISTDHSQIEQPDNPYISNYKSMPVENLFNEPTWKVGGQILNSGSSLKISSQPQANWLLVTSDDNSSWVDVNQDFEISFYLAAGNISTNGKNPHGRMRIYSNQEISLTNSIYLTFLKEFSLFQLESKEIESGEWQSLGEGIVPEDGGLVIRFEGVGTGDPENISVLEKTSGNSLYSGQLSFVFFKTGDKLGFGFEIGNGVEHILFDNLRIDSSSQD